MYAVRHMVAEEGIYGEGELHTELGVRPRVPRWPRLVREQAVADWSGRVDGHPHHADVGQPEIEPEVDPNADPEDELWRLGEACAKAYIEADALHYRAMTLLAEFDRREGWQDTGFGSTAEWLTWRIGIKLGTARERLRTALALEQLPEISEAMKNGELSFSKVRALTRVASPENETTLLDFARAGSAANLERMVRGWQTLDRKTEVAAEQIRYRSRRLSAFVDEDGMVVVRGRLDPEAGALFMRAVEAASDALFREGSADDGAEATTAATTTGDAATDKTSPEQRRADAVGLMAERALAAGFGNGNGNGNQEGPASGDRGEGQVPISGSRAERFQVMLHVERGTLEEDGEPGQSEMEDGTRVSAVTSRRIACDAGLVTITHGPDGSVLGAGRRKRTIPPSLRRALEARDRGCRFPGCGLRFTDAHHVKHWADGGETSLRNLSLLCRRHHRAVHEGGVRICIDADGQVVFFTPRGKTLLGAPPRRVDMGMGMEGVDAGKRLGGAHEHGPRRGLEQGLRRREELGLLPGQEPGPGRGEEPGPHRGQELPGSGVQKAQPSPLAGTPRWKHDRDIPWAVEAQAWEALDSG